MRLLSRIYDYKRISDNRSRVVCKEESYSMILHRRTAAITVATIVLSLVFCGGAGAAKSKKKKVVYTGRPKMVVPKNILAGSAITKGRVFYPPTMMEDTLAGIRLGRDAKDVLSKWGNPTSIAVGGSAPAASAPTVAAAPAYAPPGAGGNPYAVLASGVNAAAGMLGMNTQPIPQGGGLPPLPGYGAPGSPVPGAAMPAAPAASPSGGLADNEITYTYELNGGITVEYVITDGIVTQITVGGYSPWSLSKTHSGLQLGDTYKLAVWVCGFPKRQAYVGRFLRISYIENNRVVYTFLNKRLVGVTIAMMEKQQLQ